MKRIYVTYCSGEKDDSLKGTNIKTTPDRLYTSSRIQPFIKRCKEKGVKWAIFSDKYDVVFPHDKIEWYEKHPNSVTEKEFQQLVKNLIHKLSIYDEIYFYHNPGRFHGLYKRLVNDARQRGMNIKLISHLSDIEN